MEFSGQEYWSGLPFLSPGDLPNPGIKPGSPALQGDSLPSEPPGKHLATDAFFYGISSASYGPNTGLFFLLVDFFFSVLHVKLFHCKPECFYFRCPMITF